MTAAAIAIEPCAGVRGMDEDDQALLPPCIYCTRRTDGTREAPAGHAPLVYTRAGRWHCDQRLPSAMLGPAQG